MKHRIRRVEPLAVAKVMSILYAFMGLLLAPIFFFASAFAPNPSGSRLGIGFAIAIPLLYGAIGFVFTAIGAALYNLVAGWVGGIELDLDAAP